MPYFPVIQSEQYPATDELQCVSVYLPAGDEYKALLAGFFSLLCNPNSYDDPESAQVDGLVAVFDTAYSEINWNGCGIPPECENVNTRVDLWTRFARTNGYTLSYRVQTDHPFAHAIPAVTAAINDQMIHDVWLAEGTYEYRLSYIALTNSAIVDIHLSQIGVGIIDTIVTGLDLYGANLVNQVYSGTFDVPADDDYFIVMTATGKRVASSGYQMNTTVQTMWKQTP